MNHKAGFLEKKQFQLTTASRQRASSVLSHATLYNMMRVSHAAWHVGRQRGIGGNAREQAGIATDRSFRQDGAAHGVAGADCAWRGGR